MQLTSDQKYQLLLDISQKIRDTLDLDDILNHILDTVKTVLDYNAAGIFVLNQVLVHGRQDRPKNLIAGVVQRGFNSAPQGIDEMLLFGKGIVGHVISSGTPLIASDVRQEPHYIVGRKETCSEIAVPVIRGKWTIGALNLESDRLGEYDESDLEVLQFFADAAAISIEKAMLHRQLLDKELLEKQLETAREMQSRLFPSHPPHIPGYDIAGICIPAEEIGGDYYDFIPLEHGRLGVAVADVSGHGVSSALVMTAFRALLRTQARSRAKPKRIAQVINHLLPEFTGNNHFVTALYAILEPLSGELTYTSCGHPPPILLHADGSLEKVDCHGPALGIYRSVRFDNEVSRLAPGDLLVMYTDGVVELTDPQGAPFEVERLEALLRRCQGLSAEALMQKIIQETRDFSASATFLDDFTLVVIRRL